MGESPIEKRINIVVVGCGYWGRNLIRNFGSLESSNLIGLCDIDCEKLKFFEKIYPGVKITSNYDDLLNDSQVDAVVIALPVSDHYSFAKKALLHNKHVLVEKPITSNSKEIEELIQLAREKNKILMVDHTFEYSQPITKIKEIIDSNELGSLFYIRAEWLNLGLLQPDINVVWDLAPHIISIINYVTDSKPLKLNAKAEGYIRKDIPEISQIQIKFEKNLSAYLTFGWLEPKKTRRITIVGEKKLLIYDLTNEEEPIKIYDKGVDIIHDEDSKQPRMNYRYGDTFSPMIKNIEPLKSMCTHFIESVRYNKPPRSDGKSGLRVIKILESIDESVKKNGEEVYLDDK